MVSRLYGIRLTITIAVAKAGFGWVLLAGGAALAFGLVMIWQLERIPFFTPAASDEAPVTEPGLAAQPGVEAPAVRPSIFPWVRRRPAESQAERVTA